MTYGSLVRQLIADLEDLDAVNMQLEIMCILVLRSPAALGPWCRPYIQQCKHRGYNIGTRLIDEFLAKSKTTKCLNFREAGDKLAKVLSTCSRVAKK